MFFAVWSLRLPHFVPWPHRYQGAISAALVLGGVDCKGPHIYTVYPHGSTDNLGYATMGSGSLAAMSVFEARYKDDMEVTPDPQRHLRHTSHIAPHCRCPSSSRKRRNS